MRRYEKPGRSRRKREGRNERKGEPFDVLQAQLALLCEEHHDSVFLVRACEHEQSAAAEIEEKRRKREKDTNSVPGRKKNRIEQRDVLESLPPSLSLIWRFWLVILDWDLRKTRDGHRGKRNEGSASEKTMPNALFEEIWRTKRSNKSHSSERETLTM
ncbi:MAG TPA: hypothetical protein V6C97_15840 [Oculatellaceae cyanobacterium]